MIKEKVFLYVIYRKTCPYKKYYGITNNMNIRYKQHISKNSTCRKLKNSIQKYGCDDFIMRMIYTGNRERCSELEKYFIKRYDTVNTGYNLTYGGEHSYNLSEETKLKISISHKGKFIGKLSPNYGRIRSEEFKNKISISLTGKKRPLCVIEKMSKSLTGRKLTEEHKNNLRGKTHTAESILKMKQNGPKGENNYNCKLSDMDVITIKYFMNNSSVKYISSEFNVYPSSIRKLYKSDRYKNL